MVRQRTSLLRALCLPLGAAGRRAKLVPDWPGDFVAT